MGKIYYLMGKSASGKDRIYSLLAAHKELNLKTLVLYTTRPMRAGEVDGKNYYFTDDKKLKEFRRKGCLIEPGRTTQYMESGLILQQMTVR